MLDDFATALFALADAWRRAQGDALGLCGFGPTECSYRVVASGAHWRLRAYSDKSRGPAVLIVCSPIKRPYIWDIAPSTSALRFCLDQKLQVYMIEWAPAAPGGNGIGLDGCADVSAGEQESVIQYILSLKTPGS